MRPETTTARAADAVLDVLPVAVLVVNADGRMLLANAAARHLVAAVDGDVAPGLNRLAAMIATAASKLDTSGPHSVDLRIPTGVGLVSRHAMVGRADTSEWGDAVIATIAPDALAPVDAMAEAVGRLEAMLEHTTDIITVLDADGAIQYSNAAAGKLTGLEGTSVNGTSAFELVHPDDQPTAVERFAECLAQPGPSGPFELRIRFADGEWHDVEVVVNNLLESPVGPVVVTIHDITERKRDQERLRRSEDWHRSLLENLTDVVVVLDEAFAVTYVSPAIEKLIGAPAHSNIGMSAFNDIHPDDLAGAQATIAEVASAALGHTARVDLRLEHRPGSGTWHWLQVTVVNRLGDPSVNGIVCTLRDVTEERRAERALHDALERERETAARLRELDELKDEFLATVSHELRTPLTSIRGFAGLLQQGTVTGDLQTTMLDRVVANASDMASMIEQLLDFSRLQAGKVTIQPRPLDLATAVAAAVESLSHQLEHHDTELAVPDGLAALADPDAVGHILRNLVTNAAKYSQPGTRVRLWARAKGNEVVVAVADEGDGIPTDRTDRIFERFYRGPEVQSGRRGTGVGLSVVRRYVELHGGTVWVESELGAGSTFFFTLPRA